MYIYPDNGCKESPSCLKCKLPQCVYDMPQGDRPKPKRSMWLDRAVPMLSAGMLDSGNRKGDRSLGADGSPEAGGIQAGRLVG